MRHVLTFTGPSIGLTKPYRYQIMELDTLGRVQLWYQPPGQVWEIGHGKDIPTGSSATDVAETMRRYISGELSSDEYNRELPR